MKDYKKLYNELLDEYRHLTNVYDNLLQEFKQYKLMSIEWSTEDFTTFEIDGMEISEEQAQIALEDMIHHHDANNGISWDNVYYFIIKHGDKVTEGEEQWRKDLIKEQHSNS